MIASAINDEEGNVQNAMGDPGVDIDMMQAALQTGLQQLMQVAVRAVCPVEFATLVDLPKEAVRSASTQAGADWTCHAPVALYRRMLANQNKVRGRRATGEGATPATLEVITTTEYGTRRERSYGSVEMLAEAIIEAMPPHQLSQVAADVRVIKGGVIALTSRLRLERARMEGQLLCPTCGQFYAGTRGLRDHQQIKHLQSYGSAKAVEAESRRQLVAVTGNFQAAICQLYQHQNPGKGAKKDPLEGEPALKAARDGDLAEVQRLFAEAGGLGHGAEWKDGPAALHWSSGSGHVAICEWLVHEARVPAGTPHGRDARTPLHWACRNGQLEVARRLVAAGASCDVADDTGTVPFHLAVWQCQRDVCKWLVHEANCDWRALNIYGCNAGQWAAMAGDIQMFEWLYDLGLDMSLLNTNGHSCLHKAAVKGKEDVCKWLVETVGLGIDHMQADGDGNTPAAMARLESHMELAAWLEQLVH
ncbi:hypothetical protein CYMTET_25576 [Cymbomonas tetramitiformis]|uniref:C2H2-type domain-containing protein n=1 Tax=Cymbomonas tetramitiformis TaxID=36881 RepID=A0AAE0FTY2_9CHLO|nr:hypothetical protein CYMTET_25576 [Cymbomonas tetramitiformis]